ncbi:MAG: hypothetical protein RR632_04545 [Christensenella sp.]
MKESLFRKKSIDRISSPEQLTDYIRVSRPSIWIVLIAAVVLLGALLIWGIYGAIPDVIEMNGVAQEGTVTCYVNNPANITDKMKAEVDGKPAEVVRVEENPFSKDEVAKRFNEDYVLHMLDVGDWNYEVIVFSDTASDGIVRVKIIGNPIQPISFLLGEAAE